MTEIFYITQIDRLKRRFGDKNFDAEFIKLAGFEAKLMSDTWFQKTVDTWIGSRAPNKPPLLSEFKEARLSEERIRLNNMTRDAGQVLSHPAKAEGLKKILKEQFGNAQSVMDAVELLRLKKELKNENNDHGEDDREPDPSMA